MRLSRARLDDAFRCAQCALHFIPPRMRRQFPNGPGSQHLRSAVAVRNSHLGSARQHWMVNAASGLSVRTILLGGSPKPKQDEKASSSVATTTRCSDLQSVDSIGGAPNRKNFCLLSFRARENFHGDSPPLNVTTQSAFPTSFTTVRFPRRTVSESNPGERKADDDDAG